MRKRLTILFAFIFIINIPFLTSAPLYPTPTVVLEAFRPSKVSDVKVFRFSLAMPQTATIEVYNAIGQQVFSQKAYFLAGNNELRLPTAAWSKGLYIWGVRTEGGFTSAYFSHQ